MNGGQFKKGGRGFGCLPKKEIIRGLQGGEGDFTLGAMGKDMQEKK